MASPLISVIIPTIGRGTLEATIASIDRKPDVEVIVVADGEAAYESAKQVIGRKRIVLEHNADWSDKLGHPQRMRGMEIASGEWLSFMDDDDVYTPGAFRHLRKAARVPGPHMFCMRYWHGEVLWARAELFRGNVGTPMFFCPNDRLGTWKPERTGDFDFIESTCLKQGQPHWHEDIVALVKPHY